MSASLEQSRQQLLHTAAERADHAGGEAVEQFLRTYYRHVATEDLLARAPEDLLGAAMAHRELAQDRPVGTAKVEVFNPEVEEQGWASGHTVVQIVTDDMPFLVDSVSAELPADGALRAPRRAPARCGVRRNAAGELEELVLGDDRRPADGRRAAASGWSASRGCTWRSTATATLSTRDEVAEGLRRVLGNVREAVEDWPKMKATCSQRGAGPRRRPADRHRRRGGRAGARSARVAGRQPLHLPRLPRVRPAPRRRTPTRSRPVPGHRARAAALRPHRRRPVLLSEQARAGRPGPRAAHHHQGELARDGAPQHLPRLRQRQAVRRRTAR